MDISKIFIHKIRDFKKTQKSKALHFGTAYDLQIYYSNQSIDTLLLILRAWQKTKI